MAKDPAFLFYSQDFYMGTIDLTDEEVGKYIRILCVMHQKGRLNEKTICFLVGSVSVNLKDKFRIDDDGNWYNERLEDEAQKRANYTESRRNNGKKGGRPKINKPKQNHKDNHMDNHMGNDNDNENINDNIEGGIVKGGYSWLPVPLDEIPKKLNDDDWVNVQMLQSGLKKWQFMDVMYQFVRHKKSQGYTSETIFEFKKHFDNWRKKKRPKPECKTLKEFKEKVL